MSRTAAHRLSTQQAPADWALSAIARTDFIRLVERQGKQLYRDLPWRNQCDAYAVLVSEVMLQQTQVARVQRYWHRWIERFPTVDALAAAESAIVLETWQGLGYNRRALALKRACEQCSLERDGALPDNVEELMKLPGIGPATAAGVVAFAYNQPAVYLETNVRGVFLHELFPHSDNVSDKQLIPYVSDTCPHDNPRAWYYALLDYGAHLKVHIVNPSRRSRHYSRQSSFEGSRRQKRSYILQQVLASPAGTPASQIASSLDDAELSAQRDRVDPAIFDSIVAELIAEGFFHREGNLLVP